MKLACMTNVFRHDPPEAAFAKIAAAGFKHIELASLHCDYNTLTNALIDNIVHALNKAGLDVLSYYPYGAREHWTRMPRMFEVARRVGARTVVLGCAHVGVAKQLEPLCNKLEIDLAIENHWPEPFGRPSDFHSLNGSVSARIGAAPDVGWFAAGGQDPLEIFRVAPDRIKVVHLKDVAAAGEHRPVNFGAGVAQLERVMRELVARKFRGTITVEREAGRVIRFVPDADGKVAYDITEEPLTDAEAIRLLRQARKWALAHGAVE
ncbi:MAG: sugar phosphate isomerase/epimerase [Actinobacteria bacterium]|nr:sugar phosphate isomerase/epimerase [Actinomycetota bacterium]